MDKQIGEREWARDLAIRLNAELNRRAPADLKIEAKDGVGLLYAYEIHAYQNDIPDVDNLQSSQYETDIMVSEKVDDLKWIPRVVIECKLGTVNTHEPLAYSAKAATHKHVHPYLRYGILIGGCPRLPRRLVRHGVNFDYMVTWKQYRPDENEWEFFINLLFEELEASNKIQSLLKDSRNSAQYQSLHKRLVWQSHKNVPNPAAEISKNT
jgi:hypothetical protein